MVTEAAKRDAEKKSSDPTLRAGDPTVPVTKKDTGKVYVDPNVAPPPKPKELTPEEKKAEAERETKEKEAQAKVAKVNANLTKDGDPKKIDYQIRNGEIVYMWVNLVPTRILTEDEMAAVNEMKPAEKAEAVRDK